jgi:hypothetical protein
METANRSIQRNPGSETPPSTNLSVWRVLLLIFIPTSLLTLTFILISPFFQETIPPHLLFFILAALILFPIQAIVVLSASKQEYGRFSLESAFTYHQKLSWWKIFLAGVFLWGFAGVMTVTIIAAFLPAFYVAWKLKNIYIAMVVHILSNLVSTIGFIAAVSAIMRCWRNG